MNDPALFIVMRNDLPSLNPGKLAAQTAHCANAAVKKYAGTKMLKDWELQAGGFGTTIVFGAPFDVIYALPNNVFDPTYPCEIPREVGDFLNLYRSEEWGLHLTETRAFFLRRELVGAFFLAHKRPECLDGLELYP